MYHIAIYFWGTKFSRFSQILVSPRKYVNIFKNSQFHYHMHVFLKMVLPWILLNISSLLQHRRYQRFLFQSRTLSKIMPLSFIETFNKALKLIIRESQILALELMVAACHGSKFIGIRIIDVGNCQMQNLMRNNNHVVINSMWTLIINYHEIFICESSPSTYYWKFYPSKFSSYTAAICFIQWIVLFSMAFHFRVT